MRFRQIHLDFHTSEKIPGIGSAFSKEQFQKALIAGHVDSITVFSKCHHGWAYHPSKANRMHPNLKFDLLAAQLEACREIGVNAPVYISAGFDEKEVLLHPEWLNVNPEQTPGKQELIRPGYHLLCYNTPYLDVLCAQVEEVMERYHPCGIFLDITNERMCTCASCVRSMLEKGMDPHNMADVRAHGKLIYAEYARRIEESVRKYDANATIFHNAGHIEAGRRDIAGYDTHLELESLPTGGWGYDHFPMSSAYARTLGQEFLGMTGKFHTSWGEFGGFKHKNALRYEAALNLANGVKCSVGDQLHPNGEMSPATYSLIGAAYAEVEAKEPWCDGVRSVADVAVLSPEAFTGQWRGPESLATSGVSRMLLEGHYLFDFLDMQSDFSAYKVLILPDIIPMTPALREKLDAYVAGGGKLLASGGAAIADGAMAYRLGCVYEGPSAYRPAYVKIDRPLQSMEPASYVIYEAGHKVRLSEDGTELAQREQPYFNRTIAHFSSHQHTPNSGVMEGSAITMGPDGAYISWNLFQEYATKASLILRDLFTMTLDRLLEGRKTVTTTLPAQGVTTLMAQPAEHRLIHHLLYAVPVKRGDGIEIIEDILPVYGIQSSLRIDTPVKAMYLAPQMEPIAFTQTDGIVSYTLEKLENHQMVVLDLAE